MVASSVLPSNLSVHSAPKYLEKPVRRTTCTMIIFHYNGFRTKTDSICFDVKQFGRVNILCQKKRMDVINDYYWRTKCCSRSHPLSNGALWFVSTTSGSLTLSDFVFSTFDPVDFRCKKNRSWTTYSKCRWSDNIGLLVTLKWHMAAPIKKVVWPHEIALAALFMYALYAALNHIPTDYNASQNENNIFFLMKQSVKVVIIIS